MTPTPEMVTELYASTTLIVGIMLAAAGFASALGWAMICSKYFCFLFPNCGYFTKLCFEID